MEQIGMPPSVKELLYKPRGLVLVTGPTGSGKTTTLASMINIINEERDEAHIITIEDPIEYYHKHKKALVTQREIDVDVPNFAEALRRALRQDPDVILVGEMRDLETIEAAITAAETGHLVFGTLHTTGAAKTIDRIVNAFPTNQQEQIRIQLSTVLQAVISQLLIPRIDKPGRVAVFEIMINTPSIAALIRDNKTFRIQSDIQTGAKYGMVTLDSFLMEKYMAGHDRPRGSHHQVAGPDDHPGRSCRNWNWRRRSAQETARHDVQLTMAEEISNPLLALVKEQGLIDDLQYEEVSAKLKRSGTPVIQILQDFGIMDAGHHPAGDGESSRARRWCRCKDVRIAPEALWRRSRRTRRGCIDACRWRSTAARCRWRLRIRSNPASVDELGFVVKQDIQVVRGRSGGDRAGRSSKYYGEESGEIVADILKELGGGREDRRGSRRRGGRRTTRR